MLGLFVRKTNGKGEKIQVQEATSLAQLREEVEKLLKLEEEATGLRLYYRGR